VYYWDGKGRLVAGLVVLGAAFVKCEQVLMEEVAGPFASRGEGYEAPRVPVVSKAKLRGLGCGGGGGLLEVFRAGRIWVRR
jgi:hypothetical protein